MWLVRLRKPKAALHTCPKRPLIASVGPLLVPGRWHGAWVGRSRPGCRRLVGSGSCRAFECRPGRRERPRPECRSALSSWFCQWPGQVPVGGEHCLVGTPGGFDFQVCVVGEQRRIRWRCLSVSRSAPVLRNRRAEYNGSPARLPMARVCCCTRRRHSSRPCQANRTTWKRIFNHGDVVVQVFDGSSAPIHAIQVNGGRS